MSKKAFVETQEPVEVDNDDYEAALAKFLACKAMVVAYTKQFEPGELYTASFKNWDATPLQKQAVHLAFNTVVNVDSKKYSFYPENHKPEIVRLYQEDLGVLLDKTMQMLITITVAKADSYFIWEGKLANYQQLK